MREIVELARELGKTPAEVNDFPGFVSNRILMPFINEAAYALARRRRRGRRRSTRSRRLGFNHPMGPLALADLIGLDTCVSIMEVLQRRARATRSTSRARSCASTSPPAASAGRRAAGFTVTFRRVRLGTPLQGGRPRADGRRAAELREPPVRLLIVDDDAALRALLRTTFEVVDIEVEEAASAEAALEAVAPDAAGRDRPRRPHAGHERARALPALKADEATRGIAVVLLSGSVDDAAAVADEPAPTRSCASPSARSSCSTSSSGSPAASSAVPPPGRAGGHGRERQQLLLYARDLRHLLEIERGQRRPPPGRLQGDGRGARERARVEGHGHARPLAARPALRARAGRGRSSPDLVDDPSAEYGFLLHDVGKIGIPDRILQKPGPLNEGETRLMRTHTLLGEQMLGGVAFLQGEGLRSRPLAPRALGRRAATRTGSRDRTSRSPPASSPSPTRSTR